LTIEFVNMLFSEYLDKINMNSTKGKYGTTASTQFASNTNTKSSNFYSLETHDNFKTKNVNLKKIESLIFLLFRKIS
jgi:ubiquitin C-terminal hydrolase